MMKTLYSMALLAGLSSAAWAQFRPAIPDPQGVDFDPAGVMKLRTTEKDSRLADLRKAAAGKEKDAGMAYISLPRLFAEARQCFESGQPLPERIRYLGGMVKLQFIFVYPDEGDLVIAGPCEPFDAKVPFRPLGLYTLRPVLQLDDLVVALRSCAKNIPGRIGCDIEVTQEIVDRCQAKLKELTPKAAELGGKKVADAIADAGGNQAIIYYAVAEDSRFAFVCAEADYLLKQLALGLFKSPVSKVKSYQSLQTKPERHHRFSLDTHYEAIVASADGNAIELQGPSLKINSGLLRRLGQQEGEMSDAAKQFMTSCNKHFAEMCRHILSWADLANLSDLTVLAALIGKDRLDTRAKWNMSWVLDPKGYTVTPVVPARFAHRLCNHHYAGNMLIFTHGGVLLNPGEWVSHLKKDEEGKLKRPDRPDGSIVTPK
jgi:hypothetical protein